MHKPASIKCWSCSLATALFQEGSKIHLRLWRGASTDCGPLPDTPLEETKSLILDCPPTNVYEDPEVLSFSTCRTICTFKRTFRSICHRSCKANAEKYYLFMLNKSNSFITREPSSVIYSMALLMQDCAMDQGSLIVLSKASEQETYFAARILWSTSSKEELWATWNVPKTVLRFFLILSA